MKTSEFVDIKKGSRGTDFRDSLWNICQHGKKACLKLKEIQSKLNKDVRDYDHKSFMDVNNEIREVFRYYKNLLGNVIFQSEDEEAIKKYNKEKEIINNNINRATTFGGSSGSRNIKLSMVEAYIELWKTLSHIKIMMTDIREHDGDFRESAVYIMKLKGGREIGEKPLPPAPKQDILGGGKMGKKSSGEEETDVEGDEEDEEGEVPETGKELFKKLAEDIED